MNLRSALTFTHFAFCYRLPDFPRVFTCAYTALVNFRLLHKHTILVEASVHRVFWIFLDPVKHAPSFPARPPEPQGPNSKLGSILVPTALAIFRRQTRNLRNKQLNKNDLNTTNPAPAAQKLSHKKKGCPCAASAQLAVQAAGCLSLEETV